MPRPGSDVIIVDDATPGGPSLNTGQAFFAGVTGSGPTDTYEEVRTMKQYSTVFGPRSGGQAMYDSINGFFQEGGGVAFVAKAATGDGVGVEAALDLFNYELGPGQVCAPGLTDIETHTAMLAHADKMHRCALVDLADGDAAALQTAVTALYDLPGVRFAAALAPTIVYPFVDAAPGTVATPYSGIQAGLIARADLRGNQNIAAAGINGVSRLAVGLTADYSDDERETLNEAGVTLAKMVYGDVRTYGARTAAGPDDDNWLWFPNSRVIMAITHRADAIAQNYVFGQIDGRRQTFAKLETELRGMLLEFFNTGALYGAAPSEAFSVDTGPQVNTIDTIKAGEIHAVIRVRTSPTAEWVVIEVVKTPIDVAIAA